ncbi:hypothetical protein D3C87_1302720 [compost metagenome]
MPHQPLRDFSICREDVHHAGRQASRFAGLGQDVGRAGRFWRDLHDDRAACDQRRADLTGDGPRRCVPRNDGGHHADRFAHQQRHLAPRPGLVTFLERKGLGHRGIGQVVVADAGAARLGESVQRARLRGPDACVRFGELVQLRCHGAYAVCALAMRHAWPRALIEGLAGCSNRAVDIGLLGLCHGEKQLLGGGVGHLNGFRAGRLRPAAIDKEFVRVPDGDICVHCCVFHW